MQLNYHQHLVACVIAQNLVAPCHHLKPRPGLKHWLSGFKIHSAIMGWLMKLKYVRNWCTKLQFHRQFHVPMFPQVAKCRLWNRQIMNMILGLNLWYWYGFDPGILKTRAVHPQGVWPHQNFYPSTGPHSPHTPGYHHTLPGDLNFAGFQFPSCQNVAVKQSIWKRHVTENEVGDNQGGASPGFGLLGIKLSTFVIFTLLPGLTQVCRYLWNSYAW